MNIPDEFFESPIWQEKREFSKAEALIDYLRRDINKKDLPNAWGWTVKETKSFISLLEECNIKSINDIDSIKELDIAPNTEEHLQRWLNKWNSCLNIGLPALKTTAEIYALTDLINRMYTDEQVESAIEAYDTTTNKYFKELRDSKRITFKGFLEFDGTTVGRTIARLLSLIPHVVEKEDQCPICGGRHRILTVENGIRVSKLCSCQENK